MKTEIVLHGHVVTREAMARFKQSYMEALSKGFKQFVFDGQQVLVSYAKYVVEFAESEMGVLK